MFGAKRHAALQSKSNLFFLSLTYFFYFGQLGVFVPFAGLFLDSRNFSSSQIGTLLALVAISRIIGPNLWAASVDKSGKIGEVLRLGCLLAFITFSAIFFVYDYWLLCLTFCLMMMFWTAVLPQLEVITVKATENSQGGYGRLRVWGSIGFIVFSVLAGFLIDWFGAEAIIYLSALVLLLLYVSSMLIVAPQHKPEAHSEVKTDYKLVFSLLFIVFMLANTLLQISFGTYYNFFALYMQDKGYSGSLTGVFIAIGVTAEIFIFVYAASLLKHYKVLVLLAFSILLTSIRWLALAFFADNIIIIMLSQVIHALSFGLTHAASVYFLSQYFSSRFQSRAQALYVSITFGAGSALGSVIAGILWSDGTGATQSFVFSAACAFIAGMMLVILHLQIEMRKKKKR